MGATFVVRKKEERIGLSELPTQLVWGLVTLRAVSKTWIYLFIYLNPHPGVCLLIWEREEGEIYLYEERERERKREQCERNMDRLPPISAPAGDQTCNLLVYGRCSNPLSQPGRGKPEFLSHNAESINAIKWQHWCPILLSWVYFLLERTRSHGLISLHFGHFMT